MLLWAAPRGEGAIPPPPPLWFFFCLSAQRSVMVMIIPLYPIITIWRRSIKAFCHPKPNTLHGAHIFGNPNRIMRGHTVFLIGPPPASKVAQVRKKLMSNFFQTSKCFGQFSRHRVGVPIVHYYQPLGQAKKKKKKKGPQHRRAALMTKRSSFHWIIIQPPNRGAGGTFDTMSPTFQLVGGHVSPPPRISAHAGATPVLLYKYWRRFWK